MINMEIASYFAAHTVCGGSRSQQPAARQQEERPTP
jgi:hypothetical protein